MKWFTSTVIIISCLSWAVMSLGVASIMPESHYGVNVAQNSEQFTDIDFIGIPYIEETGSNAIKITAFSSGECHTTWCKANPERNGHQIALNARFGKYSKVYIPAFGKTYDVIGTTDQNTDADIYYGSNYEGALQFGVKHLEVELIK